MPNARPFWDFNIKSKSLYLWTEPDLIECADLCNNQVRIIELRKKLAKENKKTGGTIGYGRFVGTAEFITSANSTIDSNGFLKAASPILRLFASDDVNPDEGFIKAGFAHVNDEAKNAYAKKIAVGHYEIHGSLGFAKEGWYITLPEDANGNKKFFADYSVDENNIITIKTYTRKFDTNRCEIVAGDPIDITEGRWIDVRLDMVVNDSPYKQSEE